MLTAILLGLTREESFADLQKPVKAIKCIHDIHNNSK